MILGSIDRMETLDSSGEQVSRVLVDETNIDFCPICNSNGVRYMGTLGKLEQFECIDCGSEFSEHTFND